MTEMQPRRRRERCRRGDRERDADRESCRRGDTQRDADEETDGGTETGDRRRADDGGANDGELMTETETKRVRTRRWHSMSRVTVVPPVVQLQR
jgi:hypothetical protein